MRTFAALRSWYVVFAIYILSVTPALAHDDGGRPERSQSGPAAPPAAEAEKKGEAEEAEYRFIVGVVGSGAGGFGVDGVHGSGGAGGFIEAVLLGGNLELELAIRAMKTDEGTSVPIDLLIKKPFHVSSWFEPFMGIGPAVVPLVLKESTEYEVGGVVAVGGYFWFMRHLGVVLSTTYEIAFNTTTSAIGTELGINAGVIAGF